MLLGWALSSPTAFPVSKPNQKEQIKFKVENLKGYFPKGYSTKQMEDVIESLLKQYKQRWKSRELGR